MKLRHFGHKHDAHFRSARWKQVMNQEQVEEEEEEEVVEVEEVVKEEEEVVVEDKVHSGRVVPKIQLLRIPPNSISHFL
jgi:hypothetical protein